MSSRARISNFEVMIQEMECREHGDEAAFRWLGRDLKVAYDDKLSDHRKLRDSRWKETVCQLSYVLWESKML